MITGRCHQEAIVRIRSEQVFHAIEEEPERQENLDITLWLKYCFLDVHRIFQIAHTNRIISLSITDGIQWI